MVATATMVATAVPATTWGRAAMVATAVAMVAAAVPPPAMAIAMVVIVMAAIAAAAKHAHNGRATGNITRRAIVIPTRGGVIAGGVAGGITSATAIAIRAINTAREQRGYKQQGKKCAFHSNDIVRSVVAALGQDYSFPQAKKSAFSQPGLP